MKNSFKIYDLLNSSLAVNEEKGRIIGTQLAETIQGEIELDFTNVRVITSPFMKSLLRPLFKKGIKFCSVNFSNKINEELYQRVVNEFEKIGAESLRELN